MSKVKVLKQTFQKAKKYQLALVALVWSLGILSSLILGGVVSADRFDDQINQLKTQNGALSSARAELQAEAGDLQAVINGLQEQISSLEAQIRDNEAKRAELNQKIIEAKAEIERQRDLLGQNIRAMYLEDNMSTFEQLAASKTLSDFVDKEQYRISVEDKIQVALDKIKALEAEMAKQKAEIEQLLTEQKQMQSDLASQRAEQARLLAMNQAERTDLDNQIKANSSQISKLRSEQAAQNMRLFGGRVSNIPDTSGYPWARAPFPNTMVDPWGMYKRQCVSYTAWKVWKSGKHMPYWGGRGNANLWDDNARAAGIPVSSTPHVGDVAISNAGYYGHAMWVEHVYGDGTIMVSQYNAGWDGKYSEARISAGGLSFISF